MGWWHALRPLSRDRGFAAVAIGTLALGIGANTALFRTLDEVLLRPPRGVAGSQDLVVLARSTPTRPFQGFSHPGYLAYRERLGSFTHLTAYRAATLLWRREDGAVPIAGELVVGGYFEALGVTVAPGRAFRPEEDAVPGAHPVAILGHAAWRDRFGADPDVIGRVVRLNDTDFTVIGIAAPGFRGVELGSAVDVWIPLAMEAEARVPFPTLNDDFFSPLKVVGRLRPGVTHERASEEANRVATQLETPTGTRGERARIVLSRHLGLADPQWRAHGVQVLVPLQAAVALVLLLVCVNLAGLLLSRLETRRQEIAVRVALGAGRARIVGQLLGESLALTIPGALGGLLVSGWIAELIRARLLPELALPLAPRVAAAALLLSALAGLAFVLPSALHLTRDAAPGALAGASRAVVGRRAALGAALVPGQVAISLMLLVGAGLMVRSMDHLRQIDVGFETGHLWVVDLDLSLAGYDEARREELRERAASHLTALPQVEAVSWAASWPVDEGFAGPREIVLGADSGEGAGRISVVYDEIAADYFRTLGPGLVSGREVGVEDGRSSPRVAVVNETLARMLTPDGAAVGRSFRFVELLGAGGPVEVVGIARDWRTRSLEASARPTVFVPLSQGRERDAHLLLRVSPDAPDRRDQVRRVLHELDPGLPPPRITTMERRLHEARPEERLYTEILTFFGTVALVLSCLAVWGAQAFDVSARTPEIGVRMALGATRGRVVASTLRRGLRSALLGMGIGLVGAVPVVIALAPLAPGVRTTAAAAWLGPSALLLAAVVLACWIPARRAGSVEPSQALRSD